MLTEATRKGLTCQCIGWWTVDLNAGLKIKAAPARFRVDHLQRLAPT